MSMFRPLYVRLTPFVLICATLLLQAPTRRCRNRRPPPPTWRRLPGVLESATTG